MLLRYYATLPAGTIQSLRAATRGLEAPVSYICIGATREVFLSLKSDPPSKIVRLQNQKITAKAQAPMFNAPRRTYLKPYHHHKVCMC